LIEKHFRRARTSKSASKRRPAAGRRSLHNAEARAFEVLDKPLGDDLRPALSYLKRYFLQVSSHQRRQEIDTALVYWLDL